MPRERFTFTGHGGAPLSARLDLPEGPVLATAISPIASPAARTSPPRGASPADFAAMGFAVLRFDFTGLGQSGGAFADTTFSSNVDDLVAAASALAGRGLPPTS